MAMTRASINILSIDGGGMRGIIPAMVLQRLDTLVGEALKARNLEPLPLVKFFDVIAGTSTGAIIAAGLAGCKGSDRRPLASPDELIEFYRHDAAQVFIRKGWRDYFPKPLREKLELTRGLRGPKFGTTQAVLYEKFKSICCGTRLSEAAANLVIPAFTGEAAYVFRGGPDWLQGSQTDFWLHDVLLATTAAPYLFPPARLTAIGDSETRDFIDGGLVANNPALHAYFDALQLFGPGKDILLVSLGTASDFRPIDYHQAFQWGALKWLNVRTGIPLLQAIMQGHAHDTHSNLARLLPDPRRYIRLDAYCENPLPGFDDSSPAALDHFEAVAKSLIQRNEELLADLANRLVLIRSKPWSVAAQS